MNYKITLVQRIKTEITATCAEEALARATGQIASEDRKFEPESFSIKEVKE